MPSTSTVIELYKSALHCHKSENLYHTRVMYSSTVRECLLSSQSALLSHRVPCVVNFSRNQIVDGLQYSTLLKYCTE